MLRAVALPLERCQLRRCGERREQHAHRDMKQREYSHQIRRAQPENPAAFKQLCCEDGDDIAGAKKVNKGTADDRIHRKTQVCSEVCFDLRFKRRGIFSAT